MHRDDALEDLEHGSAEGSELELENAFWLAMRDRNRRQFEEEAKAAKEFYETTELGGQLKMMAKERKVRRKKNQAASRKRMGKSVASDLSSSSRSVSPRRGKSEKSRKSKVSKKAKPLRVSSGDNSRSRSRSRSQSEKCIKTERSKKSKLTLKSKKSMLSELKTKTGKNKKNAAQISESDFDYGKSTGRSKRSKSIAKAGKKITRKKSSMSSRSLGSSFDYDDPSISPVKTGRSKKSVVSKKSKMGFVSDRSGDDGKKIKAKKSLKRLKTEQSVGPMGSPA